MTPAVRTPDTASHPADGQDPLHYAEFERGVHAHHAGAAGHHEDRIAITAPQTTADPVARFNAPSRPDPDAANALLHNHGWHALTTWEYVPGMNLYRARVEPLRPYITAAQDAVHAVVQDGSTRTLATLDQALCTMPVNALDDEADLALHTALRAVDRAHNADEWNLLATMGQSLASLSKDTPEAYTTVSTHPTVHAVLMLVAHCSERSTQHEHGTSARTAWEHALCKGTEAFSMLLAVLSMQTPASSMEEPRAALEAAVRRAIPRAALDETRYALTEAARAYHV
ncbi:hypothetical protein [Streptomyces sp. NBC_00470]|uniref:hypothetical protein n=1 Tax=Streptomyces sp. NBC_00470 TaxID=2975753 RepID=UPI002F9182C1